MSFAKTYAEAKASYKPLARKSKLRSKKPMKRGTKGLKRSSKRISRVGPRTRAWLKVWAFLKDRFYTLGRTRCEFGFIKHECWGALYPCHSRKRREMVGDDIYAVAVGCQQIARYLDEELTHEEMHEAVMRAIKENGGLILPD